jgi:hypothetical protein
VWSKKTMKAAWAIRFLLDRSTPSSRRPEFN